MHSPHPPRNYRRNRATISRNSTCSCFVTWRVIGAVREFGERPIRGFWVEGSLDCYERDPKVIYAALGPDAFPLVPLGEVILPSEHIKEDKED